MEEKKGVLEYGQPQSQQSPFSWTLTAVFHSRKHVQSFLDLAGPHINIDCIEEQSYTQKNS